MITITEVIDGDQLLRFVVNDDPGPRPTFTFDEDE